MSFSAKEDYNMDRLLARDVMDPSSFGQLEHVLHQNGFECVYQAFIVTTGTATMDKIAFWNEDCRSYAKRYSAGFLIEIDGTFSTNKLGLILMTVVDIDSEERPFPFMF
jgi:hypothetical protein